MRIITKDGLMVDAVHVKTYTKGFLCFAQERLILVDFNFKEIESLDVIRFVSSII